MDHHDEHATSFIRYNLTLAQIIILSSFDSQINSQKYEYYRKTRKVYLPVTYIKNNDTLLVTVPDKDCAINGSGIYCSYFKIHNIQLLVKCYSHCHLCQYVLSEKHLVQAEPSILGMYLLKCCNL